MTRPLLSQSLTLRRTVVHYARPPRMPVQKSPFVPTPPRSSAGTSTPNPSAQESNDTAVDLGEGLTFHYNPPPTAPSYTTGAVPPLLKWAKGEAVALTGEEGAKLRRAGRVEARPVGWSSEVMEEIKALRGRGKSRSFIAKKLDIPAEQQHLIARVAEQSPAKAAVRAESLERRKASWQPRKALAREIRERRKAFW